MEKNNYQFLILFTVFLLFFPLGVFAGSGIIFDVTEWNTGLLDSGSVFEKDVSVANNTADNIQFHLLPGCGCLTVSEETFLVNAGSQKTFTIYFDTTDEDFGPFEKYIIIRTNSETLKKGLFAVKGSIADNLTGSSDEKKSSNEDAVDTEPSNSKFEYYYLPGCKSCAHFLSNIKYPVDKFDITNSEVYEKLQKRLSEQDIELNEVPVLFINGKPFQGEKTINNAYQAFCEGSSLDSITNTKPEKTTASTLSGFSVALAGLLDGVNPCAFTTLIFLISALSVAGRNRRGIFTVGLFYTLTVFVTYFLIGLGFFKIIRLAESFSLVSSIIRWLLFAVLLLFAALSFYDFQKVVSGNSHNIILQLPDNIKKRMRTTIRVRSRSAAVVGSSIIMGFLVSIFELGCTGQIYFPTITYLIQTGEASTGYTYLALYNVAFIIPLAIVFVLVYFGASSEKITIIFQKRLGLIKILTGFLFIAFAVLMLIY